MSEPIEHARRALEAARKAGAEHVEVWAQRGRHLGVSVDGSRVESAEAEIDAGIRVHAYVRGGRGSASAMGLIAESVAKAAAWAVENAKATDPDPDFHNLPGAAPYPEVEGLFDPALEAMGIDALVKSAHRSIASALEREPGAILRGGSSVIASETAFVNSEGAEATRRGTLVSLGMQAVVRRGDDVGSFFDYKYSRALEGFDPSEVSRSAIERARSFLGARPMPGGVTDLVLGPLSTGAFFGMSVCGPLNAESVQRNRSYFAGKKGEKIGSDFLTLRDDPLIAGGHGSRPADAEGTPSRPFVLVERGVVKSYLHNAYTAGKSGEENTGHAALGSYRRGPGISATNVIPLLGAMTAEEIIRETETGLYIDMGMLIPNPVSGDISATVDYGYRIENGELAYPVKSAMIGTNVFKMLENLDAVSSDARVDDPGTVLPTLRVREVMVAGSKG